MPILTDEERIGSILMGRYRLERILGRGGMGVVYAGEHTRSKRKVAVKLLLGELARYDAAVQRFLQEARTAAAVEHPNVVQVLDVDQAEDGAVFMAQELLRGRTLSDVLHSRGRLPVGEALDVLLPIIDALAVAHEAGIVHRDLKPENVFLAQDATGRVVPKLLDFGIAKVLRGGLATMTGTMVGSPAFMSPEQAECRRDVGPATDVWSMGVVLHRCLAGAFPVDFPEDASPASVLAAILTRPPRSLAGRAPELPQHVVAAVDRALEREPRARHPNMRALYRALRGEATGVTATVLAAPPTAGAGVTGSASATLASSTGTQMWTPAPAKGPTPFGWNATKPGATETPASPWLTKRVMAGVGGAAVLAMTAAAITWAVSDSRGDGPRSASSGSTPPAPPPAPAADPSLPPAPALPDAGLRLTGTLAQVPDANAEEPLLPPVTPLDRPEESRTTARRSESSRPRASAARPAALAPAIVPQAPTLRPRPTVIDNGIRIPE